MKDRNFFTKHPGFLKEDFRNEMGQLVATEEETVSVLLEHIRAHADYEALVDEKSWVQLAEKTKMSIDDLQGLFRPLRYMTMAAIREQRQPEDIVACLSEKGIVESFTPDIRQRTANLMAALRPALAAAYEETPPRLPGLRIKSMSSSANLISEFENEFDISVDDPESYAPQIRRAYAYTTLRLAFRDDEHDPLTIVLAEDQLKDLVRWLQLAEVQQCALKEQLPATPEKAKVAE